VEKTDLHIKLQDTVLSKRIALIRNWLGDSNEHSGGLFPCLDPEYSTGFSDNQWLIKEACLLSRKLRRLVYVPFGRLAWRLVVES
jgi:hypothetical protein